MSDWRAALDAFPRERTWLLPALQAVQHHLRWIPSGALAAVAAHLRVPASEVYGVATHYPEFRLSEPGKRVVRVCTGVSCRISGGLECLEWLERRLGAHAPATTADGTVTLEPFDCAFNCSVAPVLEVDHQYHGRIRVQDLEHVLNAPPPGSSPLRIDGPATADRSSYFELVSHAQSLAHRGLTLVVGVGSCSLSVGAGETLLALNAEVTRRGLQAPVVPAGCSGLCWAAPALTVIHPDGTSQLLPQVTADRVPALLDAALAKRVEPHPGVTDFLRHQRRELTSRCGVVNPHDIADAVRRGSYAALAEALAGRSPEHITQTVKAAGLRGRGGAYFAAATKWEGARQAPGSPKYLIVNAEEGEPGIFKDRHLMEGDPHRLLEGALLAAYASGATRIILYIHGEAHLSAQRIQDAVESARGWGFVGARILESDFSVEVEIRRGAGGFVLGEETALMESLEGRRAMPRPKPPFPTEAGLFGKPTVINNVETLFAVPLIAARGEKWWAGLGRGHGTKCFGLSGHVARPGVVEVEMGSTLRDLLERIGGGVPRGRALKGVVVGGPSGTIVPPRDLDEPLLPGGRVNPGTGGLVALDETVSIREVIRTLLDFNTRESCGKCTPCREGTARLRDMLDAPGALDQAAITELSEVVRVASLCGLGQAAPLSLLAALRDFPDMA
ncbi:MAG TPA: NAD(P)H-dependent oxidoreductase subunit E [Methylomirabilota bacterium]|nr:NAD(P)H-dependent oxidoreductase subunit E [Methylomirabilota bacterium]